MILDVNLRRLDQALTPDRLRGRLRATLLFVSTEAMPLGTLADGTLGDAPGLRPTRLVGGIDAFAGGL